MRLDILPRQVVEGVYPGRGLTFRISIRTGKRPNLKMMGVSTESCTVDYLTISSEYFG